MVDIVYLYFNNKNIKKLILLYYFISLFLQSSSPVKMWWGKSFVGKGTVGKSPCGQWSTHKLICFYVFNILVD